VRLDFDSRRSGWRLEATLRLAFLCALASAASAQGQRPSLSGLEEEIARTRAALCARADVFGETYRPFFCPPRCDCLDTATLMIAPTQTVTCEESPAFRFVIDVQGSMGTCSEDACISGQHCASSSFDSCSFSDPDCPTGETCLSNNCVLPCSSDAECTGDALCSASSLAPCSQSSDCPFPAENLCVNGTCRRTCSFESTCQVSAGRTLDDVRDPDSPIPADCGIPINSADALQCLADVEAAFGITCSVICGNGVVQGGETCDDGNTTSGDGCDASCQLEP